MSTLAPHRTIISTPVAAVGTAGNTLESAIGDAPYAGAVTAVDYIPADDITGAATNNRRLRLVNKGQDGEGTAIVAELQFVNNTDADGFAANALTLSSTSANLQVEAGDVLAWESTHIGSGITDPGGIARVVVERA